jgi:hypothetical protein
MTSLNGSLPGPSPSARLTGWAIPVWFRLWAITSTSFLKLLGPGSKVSTSFAKSIQITAESPTNAPMSKAARFPMYFWTKRASVLKSCAEHRISSSILVSPGYRLAI